MVNEVDSSLKEKTDMNTKISFASDFDPPPDLIRTVKKTILENDLKSFPNAIPPRLRKRPASSEVSDFTIDSDLVIKICLLEDAVRNAIISVLLQLSSLLLQPSSELESMLSGFGAVTSSSSRFVPVDWSINNVQKIFTINHYGTHFLYSVSDSKLIFAQRFWDVNRLVSIEQAPDPQHRTHSYRGPFKLNVSAIVSDDPSELGPTGMCMYQGYLYVLDFDQNSIHIWEENEASLLGTVANGEFQYPSGCIVYKDELYVSDLHNHRIQVFSLPNGEYLRKFGSLGSGEGELNEPHSLQVYQDQLFVADSKNNRVSVFNPTTGAFLFHIGSGLSPSESLEEPQALLIHQEVLFVALPKRVVVMTCEGKYLYSFGSDEKFFELSGLAMFKDRLFVVDGGQEQINVYEQI